MIGVLSMALETETAADVIAPERQLRVFISYSRADSAFAAKLRENLIENNIDAYLDQYDIAPGEPWQERLSGLITRADTVVFCLSPHFIQSEICDWEVNEAERLGKRLIPVVANVPRNEDVPQRLKRLNYIFMRDEIEYSSGLAGLIDGINTDVAWVREHSRLVELAQHWMDGDREEGLLLSYANLTALSKLLSDRPRTAPDPTISLLEFRDASQAKLDADRDRQRRIIGRGFVKPSEQAFRTGNIDHALRVAAAGAVLSEDVDFDRELDTHLSSPAYKAIFHNRTFAVLRGHKGKVTAAAFSPHSNRIATASLDATGRVWDACSGAEIAVLLGHKMGVNSVAFSPDGARIVTASKDKTARIWDARSGAEIAVLQWHESEVATAEFSPDGARILTASKDDAAVVWDASSGAPIMALRRGEYAPFFNRYASFSPDGSLILAGPFDALFSEKEVTWVWDASSGAPIKSLRGGKFASFSPDASRILTGSNQVRVFVNAYNIIPTAIIKPPANKRKEVTFDNSAGTFLVKEKSDELSSGSFSPGGVTIVTSQGKTARIWDARSGAEIATMQGHESNVSTAVFSPDGARMVTASEDKTARIWDTRSGAEIAVLQGHESEVATAEFSPDGTRVLTTSGDSTARVWDALATTQIRVLQGHESNVSTAVFSPDGARIVTASEDKTGRVWDARSGAEVAVLRGHEGRLLSVAFSPDGAWIVTASEDKTGRIWDALSGASIAVLQGHEGWVSTAAFSLDGARIVTASEDKTARVWDVGSGAEVAILRGHENWVKLAAFNPDGARFITVSRDRTARIWGIPTGTEITVLRGHKNWVNAAVFSSDGTQVLTASGDGTACVWNAANGAKVAILRGHDDVVLTAAFSPDGARIVTASSDATARIWDARSGAEIAVLRGHATRVNAAIFSPDGERIVTISRDATTRVWDASRTKSVNRTPSVLLAAGLASGVGQRTAAEAQDVVMQDSPVDLFAAVVAEINQAAQGESEGAVEEVAAALRKPLHPNCYLSPTQFNALMGIEQHQGLSLDEFLDSTGTKRRRLFRTFAVAFVLALIVVAAAITDWQGYFYASQLQQWMQSLLGQF
jgi:WD40 repeat protein